MTASIFAGSAGEWTVARRLQAGTASYPLASRLLMRRLALICVAAMLLAQPAARGRDAAQDHDYRGRVF